MNLKNKLMILGSVCLLATGFASCSDDDLGDTIFNTNPSVDYLDKSSFTFPLDTFIKVNYNEPYNIRMIYRLEDKATDMSKNLTPATYDNSVDMAVLTKYLWYDAYKAVTGSEAFMKTYSPRIIQLCGSKNYNPSQGTEVLGDASSGVKINLYNVNNLDVNNVDMMNQYFFHTMHHEFGHILDQTHLHPTEFNLLSAGHYDATGWNETPDSVAAGRGFVSPYASMMQSEDWAETVSTYITADTLAWTQLLASSEYEWELKEIDDLAAYNKLLPSFGEYSLDTIGYFQPSESGKPHLYRRACVRDGNDHVVLGADGKPQWTHNSGIDGKAIILRKLDLARNYLKTYYNISIDELRAEVQKRTFVTNADGSFVYDRLGRLVNKLTYKQDDGTTLLDQLRQEVNKYKSLQK